MRLEMEMDNISDITCVRCDGHVASLGRGRADRQLTQTWRQPNVKQAASFFARLCGKRTTANERNQPSERIARTFGQTRQNTEHKLKGTCTVACFNTNWRLARNLAMPRLNFEHNLANVA